MSGMDHDSKIRIIAVYNMLKEGKRVKAAEIIQRLELRYGITASRHTIADDIRSIDKILPVYAKSGRYGGYKLFDFTEAMEK